MSSCRLACSRSHRSDLQRDDRRGLRDHDRRGRLIENRLRIRSADATAASAAVAGDGRAGRCSRASTCRRNSRYPYPPARRVRMRVIVHAPCARSISRVASSAQRACVENSRWQSVRNDRRVLAMIGRLRRARAPPAASHRGRSHARRRVPRTARTRAARSLL